VKTFIEVVLIVALVALFLAERYFLFGRGRQMKVGRPSHWWNKPITRLGRRTIGAAGAVFGIVLLILQLRGNGHHAQGYVGDAFLIVPGLLLALGVLPRVRNVNQDKPGRATEPR
jgi:hypothetical protein